MTWTDYLNKYYPNLKQEGWQRRRVVRAEIRYRHYSVEVQEYINRLKGINQ